MALKAKCILTGFEKAVRQEVLDKRYEKYGSKERCEKIYICQEASTLLKAGKTVAQVREELKSSCTNEVPQEAIDFVFEKAGKKTFAGTQQAYKEICVTTSEGTTEQPKFRVNRSAIRPFCAAKITDPEDIMKLTENTCWHQQYRRDGKCQKECPFFEHCILRKEGR